MSDQSDSQGSESPPAGWYPDPDSHGTRYWDGTDWTDRRMPATQATPTETVSAGPTQETTPAQAEPVPAGPTDESVDERSWRQRWISPMFASTRPRGSVFACVVGVVVWLVAGLTQEYIKPGFVLLAWVGAVAAIGLGLYQARLASEAGTGVTAQYPQFPRYTRPVAIAVLVLGALMLITYVSQKDDVDQYQDALDSIDSIYEP